MKIAKWLVPVALFWLAATIAVMAQEPPRAERQAAQSDVTAAEVADPIDRLIEALKDDAARDLIFSDPYITKHSKVHCICKYLSLSPQQWSLINNRYNLYEY